MAAPAPPVATGSRTEQPWLPVALPVAGWMVGAILLRTLLAALVPILPDESYYWEWSRRLATGYFDHPPAIAWLLATSTGLGGATPFGVRLGPALAALATQGAVVAGAWQLAGGGPQGWRAAHRGAQLTAVLPLAAVGLVLATPDAVLFAAATVALLAVERALAAPLQSRTSMLWWTLAGVGLGLAFTAKFTAVLLPFALVVACLLHPALRLRFTEPGPWVASAIALLIFAPVLWWNAEHDWVSFRFQLGHGLGSGPARGTPLTRILEMIGGQLGLASPILFVLMMQAVRAAMIDGWHSRASTEPTALAPRRFAMAMLAVVPLAFFAVSATRKTVEPNWPAMLYPGAMLLVVTAPETEGHRRWWRRGIALAAGLVLLLAVQAWRPVLPVRPGRDPVARAYGWTTLADAVQALRQDQASGGAPVPWVAADRYQDASELAFHLPDQPTVFSLNLGGRANQYDLWPAIESRLRPGDDLVAVFDASAAGDSLAHRLHARFRTLKQGADVILARDGGEITRRRLWLLQGARRPSVAP